MSGRPRVLVVTAMPREAAAAGRGARVCGAGERAGAAVEGWLRAGEADAVVIAGVCGGLDPSLAPGALVVARRVLAEGAAEVRPPEAVFARARQALRESGLVFVSSALLSVGRAVGSRAEKTALWNAHGAAGIDMESYAVARAAEAHGVPWLALRAVLEPAGDGLPPSLRSWDGEPDGQVVRAALRRPLEWPAYVRLVVQARRAMRSLRAATPVVVAAIEAALRDEAAVSGAAAAAAIASP